MIIGLTGYAGSGKDTAGLAFKKLGFRLQAFADPVRKGLLALDPLISDSYVPTMSIKELRADGQPVRLSEVIEKYGWDGLKTKAYRRTRNEVRRLLQRYGTEAGRDIHGQNCWVDAAQRALPVKIYYSHLPGISFGRFVVFTDVRFLNEASWILTNRGVIIRIIRPGIGPERDHSSETEQDRIEADYTIANDSTIDDLNTRVRDLVAVINKSKIIEEA